MLSNPTLTGAVVLGIPLIVLAWAVLWRRTRPVFWFALVLSGVGLGYLAATGALADIGHRAAGVLAAKRA